MTVQLNEHTFTNSGSLGLLPECGKPGAQGVCGPQIPRFVACGPQVSGFGAPSFGSGPPGGSSLSSQASTNVLPFMGPVGSRFAVHEASSASSRQNSGESFNPPASEATPGSQIIPVQEPFGGINNKKKGIIRVGTWNVRSMNGVGRLENLKREMSRLKLAIVGISEVRWKEENDFWSEEFRVINTRGLGGQAGVGIVMNREIGSKVIYYKQQSERLILVKINTKPVITTVVQVYMPTSSHEDEEIEEVYEELEELIKHAKGEENLIIMGDWNARVGEGKEGNIVGEYGLGERNERGDRLVQFCAKHKLVIGNTLFKNHPRRRYTWESPGNRGRYQIDYILTKQRFRNQILDCKTFPGADIDSDHNLVVMKCRLKLKKITRKGGVRRWDVKNLKNFKVREKFQNDIVLDLAEKATQEERNVEEKWRSMKEGIIKAAEENIGKKKEFARKRWMKEEILEMIDERRKFKNAKDRIGKQKYQKLRNEIKRECKKAKEEWMKEKGDEIETLIKKGQIDLAYGKVKTEFGKGRKKANNITSKIGEPIYAAQDKVARWVEYIEELYRSNDNEEVKLEEDEGEGGASIEDKGEPILRTEFEKALKELKQGKAAGVDEIPGEILQNIGEGALKVLYELICYIYETGEMPEDFKRSVIVTIPKKAGADKCEYYRTISLLSHASKILTRIIYRRIEKRIDEELGEDQFGFRKNRGTREAILALRLIMESRYKKGKDTYMAFVDIEKAFDNVKWNKMFEILKETGIKFNERRTILNLYKGQKAMIRIEGEEGEANIKKGVRQGCSLSPVLFNLYIENAIKEVKEKFKAGVTVHGERIKMLRFADDIVLVAEKQDDLEEILNGLENVLNESYSMRINKSKTKVMVCNRCEHKNLDIKIGTEKIQEVEEFCYLGSKITKDGRSKRDIKCRIAQAKIALYEKINLFRSGIDVNIKKQFLKTYIWSVALYGSETWTIGNQERKSIEAFEMWCYRRILGIKWTDKITNKEVLERIGERMGIWNYLKRRRDKLIGHNIRHPGILMLMLEGMVEGKNWVGRHRFPYIKQIWEDVGCKNYREMKELAFNREKWRAASNRS